MFEDVFSVPPGTTICISGNNKLEINRWFDIKKLKKFVLEYSFSLITKITKCY